MGTSGMKRCELCKSKARVHCESDRASLCWDCDAKVHSANFLVARHSRNLLCRICQSPTPWSATGAKLGATVSICEECVDREECDESSGEESAGEVVVVVEESQRVPWSPPPPEESSSSIEDAVSGGDEVVSRKRSRTENDSSKEDHNCATSHLNFCYPTPADMAAVVAVTFSERKTTSPRKMQRTESVGGCGSGILDRVPEEATDPGEEMTEFCSSSGPSI